MEKSPDAFRTISEAADDLDLPQHVLRFWETRFTQIKPMKRGGGRRYYRPDDVDLLRGIRHLLYEEGYTIKGVQRILREQGNKFVIQIGTGEIDISDPGALVTPPVVDKETEPAPRGEGARFQGTGALGAGAGARGAGAMSVEEFTASRGEGKSAKSAKGILGRFRGREEVAEQVQPVRVSDDDRRHLQATLYELLECKRLLDQVRSD